MAIIVTSLIKYSISKLKIILKVNIFYQLQLVFFLVEGELPNVQFFQQPNFYLNIFL
jgi:hypothetical protein